MTKTKASFTVFLSIAMLIGYGINGPKLGKGDNADSNVPKSDNRPQITVLQNKYYLQQFFPPPSCQTSLSSYRYTIKRAYDLAGNLIQDKINIKDRFGRLDLTQSKNISTNSIIAVKNVYDKYGRLAITSLPAPVSATEFCYDNNFMNYSFSDFDLDPTANNLTGEIFNPRPISASTTLGNYYSNSSTNDKIATSEYPFIRKYYSDNSYDKVIGSSGYSSQFLGNDQKFARTYDLAPSDELRYLYGVEGSYLFNNETGNGIDFGDLRLRKKVTITPDEDVVVEYLNEAGDQTVAVCRSETPTDCLNQTTRIPLVKNNRTDIHIPSATQNTMKIKFPDPGWFWKNTSQQNDYCLSCFELELFDVINNVPLEKGVDYVLTNDPLVDATIYEVEFLTLPTDAPAIIGVSYDLTPQAFDVFQQFFQFDEISLGPIVSVDLDYSNWELYYYDLYGNLAKRVQPEGVNCNYDASQYFNKKENFGMSVHRDNTHGPKKTILEFDIHPKPSQQLEREVALNIHPTWIHSYGLDPYNGQFYQLDPCYMDQAYSDIESESTGYSQLDPEQKQSLWKEVIVPTEDFLDLTRTKPQLADDWSNPTFNRKFTPDQDGFIKMEVAPEEPTTFNTRYVKQFKQSFKIYVDGRDANGDLHQLEAISCTLTKELRTYIVSNPSSNGQEKLQFGDMFIEMGSSLLPWQSAYKFDDVLFQDYNSGNPASYLSNLKDYESIRLSVGDAQEYDKWYISESNQSGSFPVATSWNWINSCRYVVVGNFGYKIQSKPDDIEHKALIENYDHNIYGNLLSKTIPDEGTSKFLYDSKQRLRFSENQTQRTDNRFSYTLYDKADRIIESGKYDNDAAVAASGQVVNFTEDPPQGTLDESNVHYYLQDGEYLDPQFCEQVTEFYYDVPTNDLPGSLSNFEQHHLAGKLVKTYKYPTTTWYSYDFYGNTEWVISHNYTMGYQTFRYVRNSAGDVIEVKINENNSSEDFYLKYSYDADKRLKEVHSSTKPNSEFTLVSKLIYDELGNISRKEYGDKFQGQDFVYTIQGYLKSINNPLPDHDLGGDEVLGNTNYDGFEDLFSENITYYTGDYEHAGTHIQCFDNQDFDNQYSGLVKGVTWNSKANLQFIDTEKVLAYGYDYDRHGQLNAATFGTSESGSLNPPTGGGTPPVFTASGIYDVFGINYDKNGNIEGLNRLGSSSAFMDRLSYNYTFNQDNELTSNQVTHVTDAVAGFTYANELENQQTSNYIYDSGGRLVEDKDRGITITYYDNGLVKNVKTNDSSPKLIQEYFYDDRGNRFKTKHYDTQGVLVKKIFRGFGAGGTMLWEQPFVFDSNEGLFLPQDRKYFIYDQSRVATAVISGTNINYHYELKDHIGNVRSVFTNDRTSYLDYTFNSSLEEWSVTSNAEHELADRKVIINTGLDGGLYRTLTLSQGQRYHLTIDVGAIEADAIVISIKDNVTLESIVNAELEVGLNEFYFRHKTNNDIEIKLHVDNPGPQEIETSFSIDNVKIEKEDIEILKYADYYPFGWELPGRQYVSSAIDNDRGYQGDYSFKNNTFTWNEFELRNYDSRLGRWLSVDPARQYHSLYMAMGNNPISVFDPDGAWGYYNPETKEYRWFDNVEIKGDFVTENGNSWQLVSTSLAHHKGTLNDDEEFKSELYTEEGRGKIDRIENEEGYFKIAEASGMYDLYNLGEARVIEDADVGNSYFDYNDDGEVSGREVAFGVLDVGGVIFDIATFPSGEGVALHAALGGLARATTRKGALELAEQGGKKIIRNIDDVTSSAAKGAKTFFDGAKYSPKVLRQMGKADDLFHGFPKSIDGYATKFGKWSTEVGADGKTYQWLKMPGSYGDKTGTFEFIKDANGVINHRFFNVH